MVQQKKKFKAKEMIFPAKNFIKEGKEWCTVAFEMKENDDRRLDGEEDSLLPRKRSKALCYDTAPRISCATRPVSQPPHHDRGTAWHLPFPFGHGQTLYELSPSFHTKPPDFHPRSLGFPTDSVSIVSRVEPSPSKHSCLPRSHPYTHTDVYIE